MYSKRKRKKINIQRYPLRHAKKVRYLISKRRCQQMIEAIFKMMSNDDIEHLTETKVYNPTKQ